MKVTVCIGSACHIKGSRRIIEQLQSLIEQERIGGKVELAGSFCMNNCLNGVCVTVDGELYSVSPETVKDFFYETVMPKL